MPITATRRQFLNAVSLASAGALIRVPQVLAAEEALETTAVRLLKFPGICIAPQYAAEQLLRAEGFTDVRYVDWEPNLSLSVKVGRGDADFSLDFAGQSIQAIDSGAAITILGGVHVGCYELFAKDEIRSVGDLKNRTIGIRTGGANPHVYLTAMAAHIGVTRPMTFVGSPAPTARTPSIFSSTARLTPTWLSRPSLRNCGLAESATLFSTASSTARGRSISAACSPAIGSSSWQIRSPLNACCAPL
jgi:NitT/TauT family transport system substrate-binding protein